MDRKISSTLSEEYGDDNDSYVFADDESSDYSGESLRPEPIHLIIQSLVSSQLPETTASENEYDRLRRLQPIPKLEIHASTVPSHPPSIAIGTTPHSRNAQGIVQNESQSFLDAEEGVAPALVVATMPKEPEKYIAGAISLHGELEPTSGSSNICERNVSTDLASTDLASSQKYGTHEHKISSIKLYKVLGGTLLAMGALGAILVLLIGMSERFRANQNQTAVSTPTDLKNGSTPSSEILASPIPSHNRIKLCFKTSAELPRAVHEYTEGKIEATVQSYGPVRDWCVTNITNFSTLFRNKKNFNEPLDHWDLSTAVTTANMFENAIQFNQNLSNWNVGSVTSMDEMFLGASKFNVDLSTWDTSKVISMRSMFRDAIAFNQDLSTWNVSLVTSINSMFYKTQSFHQNLSSWNTSRVTDMGLAFFDSRSFNGDISTWDTSRVTTMRGMFQGASNFNGDLSFWNTSTVVDMSYMFWLATRFRGAISSWEVSSVRDMTLMFQDANSFSFNLCDWGNQLDSSVRVKGAFLGTRCPNSTDPVFDAIPPGPFCHACK